MSNFVWSSDLKKQIAEDTYACPGCHERPAPDASPYPWHIVEHKAVFICPACEGAFVYEPVTTAN